MLLQVPSLLFCNHFLNKLVLFSTAGFRVRVLIGTSFFFISNLKQFHSVEVFIQLIPR